MKREMLMEQKETTVICEKNGPKVEYIYIYIYIYLFIYYYYYFLVIQTNKNSLLIKKTFPNQKDLP
jgi:hypothetical protein